jgi:hypothetical protein
VWSNEYEVAMHFDEILGTSQTVPAQQIGPVTPAGTYYDGNYGLEFFLSSGNITLNSWWS